MDGIQTLQSRSNVDISLMREVNKIIDQESHSIEKAQDRILNQQQDSLKIGLIESKRSFSVSQMTLHHNHNIQQRFIDMKRTRYGKQKAIPVHNKIIYGHWNNIIFRARYEVMYALKKQISTQLKLEL